MKVKGWSIQTSQCGRYLYVLHESDSNQIHIRLEDENLVVDVWDQAGIDLQASLSTERRA